MQFLLVDDDDTVRSNLEEYLVTLDLGYDIQSIHFDNVRDNAEEIMHQLQNLKNEDFLMIDLFLGGQSEAKTPYLDLKSVKLVLSLKISKKHVIFYSNGNEREPDALFQIFSDCHYLPVKGAVFDKGNKKEYEKYDRKRKHIADKIKGFLIDTD